MTLLLLALCWGRVMGMRAPRSKMGFLASFLCHLIWGEEVSIHVCLQEMKSWQIPAFGNWDYGNEMPVIGASLFREDGLFTVPVAMPVSSAHLYGSHCRRKGRKENETGVEKQYSKEQKPRKQGNLCDAAKDKQRRRPPKAVDEDLCKIPPELLYQKAQKEEGAEESVIRMSGSQLHLLSL